jgi:predicted ArsR family transcriptional regulator
MVDRRTGEPVPYFLSMRTLAVRSTRETVLALMALHNKKPREVATILGISTQAVYKHLRVAKVIANKALLEALSQEVPA